MTAERCVRVKFLDAMLVTYFLRVKTSDFPRPTSDIGTGKNLRVETNKVLESDYKKRHKPRTDDMTEKELRKR